MSATGTETQLAFARAYARNGGKVEAAALEAGYAATSAAALGYRALDVPAVKQAIMEELLNQRTHAGAVGLKTLVSVAENDKLPAAARVAAGRALMEFSGIASAGIPDAELEGYGVPTPNYREVLDRLKDIGRAAGIGATVQ